MKRQVAVIGLGALLTLGIAAASFARGDGGSGAGHVAHSRRTAAIHSTYSSNSGYYDMGAGAYGSSSTGGLSGSIGGIGH